MTAVTYRPAHEQDCPAMAGLLRAMAAEGGGIMASTAADLRAQGFGPEPRFAAVLALAPDPQGLCLYFPEYSTWRAQLGLFVQDLYLAPALRGRGHGRALLQAAILAMRPKPAFVSLMVARDNAPARAFYARMGFSQRSDSEPLIAEAAAFSPGFPP